ncbi:hypothetical protein GCM10007981_10240 [Thermocladium modestius]|uniref:CRISPR type III-associated protein domain-containing protein n=1 Tax=Thermocladium modestius TaxID=62609 RepID=A0A830GV99_9CREN|nr:RAMP superfamily CRISPR-associated protein [Thermocladium modestius]GGP20780.1 hypothetical protein GCM10007981_10240 [Thermocladium modestius]
MVLAQISASLATPLLSGSADPNEVDVDYPIRPSEVKGIWRWWARSLVAGALFNRGLLNGESNKNAVKTPTKAEASVISEIVGIDMGLGYVGRGKKHRASCFSIEVETMDNVSPKIANNDYNIRDLNRVKLLTLGKRQVEYLDQLRIRIIVDDHLNCGLSSDAVKASLGALGLALNLSCLGKGGRRGLGCLDIQVEGNYSRLFNMEWRIGDAVNEAMNYVDKVVGNHVLERMAGSSGRSRCSLSPIPSVTISDLTNCVDRNYRSNRDQKLFSFQVITMEAGKDKLQLLHNFFLRPERARATRGDPRGKDDLRLRLMAWILGLPREQRGTGYEITSGSDRRASPMLLAVHGKTSYLTVLTSADWPRKLMWIDGGNKPINISENDIINATYTALNEFTEYLNRRGIRWHSWP